MRSNFVVTLLIAGITAIVLCAMILACPGCSTDAPAPSPTQPTASSIADAKNHVDSAEAANQRIKPHADKAGQELVGVVSDEHKAADAALAKAKAENAAAQVVIDNQKKQIASVTADYTKVKNSWGYRAEVAIQAFLTLLLILVSVHVLVGAAAVILPVFFPATLVAVPILKTVGAICNPAAWLQFAYDHIHLAKCTATAITVQQV